MSISRSISKHMTPKMLMTVGAPVAAVVAVAGIAMGSNAAFIATTDTATNNWTTGVVQLTNDHVGVAAFSPGAIVPGYAETHCIVVTSNSTVPTDIKLYATSSTIATPLGAELQFNIQSGTGGTDVPGVNGAPGSCDGFTPDAVNSTVFDGSANTFMTEHLDAASGAGTVSLNPGESKTYLITATLPDSNNQGASTSTAFTWAATSK